MVIDSFMWHNEIDMLELRLRMLDEHVDWFVAVESDRTHSGVNKEWHLGDHADRLARWWHKIVWIKHKGVDEGPWSAENRQRRSCKIATEHIVTSPDDIVIVSDVDEIWHPDCLSAWSNNIRAARMDFRIFSLYWKFDAPWPGSIGGPWSMMKDADWQALRDARFVLPFIELGWHFSWMGTDQDRVRKRDAFAHREFSTVDIEHYVAKSQWLDGQMLHETEAGLPAGVENYAPDTWKIRRQ